MNDLNQYKIKAADWREDLRRNNRKTRMVVILFILIYVTLGLIFDLYLYTSNEINLTGNYNNTGYNYSTYTSSSNSTTGNTVTPSDIENELKKLLTLQNFPIATFVMLIAALISLLITYFFHNQITMLGTEYHEITGERTKDQEIKELQLYNIIEELKIAAGLRFMPKVYIIEADYMNAFASGFGEKSSMVAITRGLLEKLDRDEIQAVMAHEMSHVRHNDIRLTMMVAVLSNLILIFIDIAFRGILFTRRSKDNNGLYIIIVLARFLLPIVTVLLMLYLSRTREYMADAGCVELTRDNQPLARALLKIHNDTQQNASDFSNAYKSTPHEEVRQASYFYDPKYAGIASLQSFNSLFSTHPPLEDRLKALGIEAKDSQSK